MWRFAGSATRSVSAVEVSGEGHGGGDSGVSPLKAGLEVGFAEELGDGWRQDGGSDQKADQRRIAGRMRLLSQKADGRSVSD